MGTGGSCGVTLGVLASVLLVVGVAESSFYFYVRTAISRSLFKTHCWLWTGVFTSLASSLILLLLLCKPHSNTHCFIFIHFIAICVAQLLSWVVAEVLDWRIWWTDDGQISRRSTRIIYIQVYALTTLWGVASIVLSILASFISCATHGCLSSSRSFNMLDATGKSAASWNFLRVRSSTPKNRKKPKSSHRFDRMLSSKNGRRLTLETDLFAGHLPLTPIAPTRPVAMSYRKSSTATKTRFEHDHKAPTPGPYATSGRSSYLGAWNKIPQDEIKTSRLQLFHRDRPKHVASVSPLNARPRVHSSDNL